MVRRLLRWLSLALMIVGLLLFASGVGSFYTRGWLGFEQVKWYPEDGAAIRAWLQHPESAVDAPRYLAARDDRQLAAEHRRSEVTRANIALSMGYLHIGHERSNGLEGGGSVVIDDDGLLIRRTFFHNFAETERPQLIWDWGNPQLGGSYGRDWLGVQWWRREHGTLRYTSASFQMACPVFLPAILLMLPGCFVVLRWLKERRNRGPGFEVVTAGQVHSREDGLASVAFGTRPDATTAADYDRSAGPSRSS